MNLAEAKALGHLVARKFDGIPAIAWAIPTVSAFAIVALNVYLILLAPQETLAAFAAHGYAHPMMMWAGGTVGYGLMSAILAATTSRARERHGGWLGR